MTKHIIINGTCEHMDEVPDESISLVITSPPYFNAKDYGATGEGNIGDSQGELLAEQRYETLMENVYRECYKKLKYGGHMIVNVADVICEGRKYPTNIKTGQILLKVFNGKGYLDTVMWKKPDGMSSQKRFGIFIQNPHPMYWRPNNMYEPWFVFVKGKKDYSKRSDSNKLNWEKYKKYQTDVWEVQPETSKGAVHPAPFPRLLPEIFIQLLTYPGDWVLEPFLGSGTTMEMARNNDRNCYGYELNMDYIDKAVKPFLGIQQGMPLKSEYPNTIYSVKDLAQNEYYILLQSTIKHKEEEVNETKVENKTFEIEIEGLELQHTNSNIGEVRQDKDTPIDDWHNTFGSTNKPRGKEELPRPSSGSTGGQPQKEAEFDIITSELSWEDLVKEKKSIKEEKAIEKAKKLNPKESEMTDKNPLISEKEKNISAFHSSYIDCEYTKHVCVDCFDSFDIYMGNVVTFDDNNKETIISKYDHTCPSCSSNRIQLRGNYTIRKWKEKEEAIQRSEPLATEEEIKIWG